MRKCIKKNVDYFQNDPKEFTLVTSANANVAVAPVDTSFTARSIPDPLDYQLKDLLAAGIKLDNVPTSDLLDPTTPEALAQRQEAVALGLMDQLYEEPEPTPEPTPDPTPAPES